MNDLINKDLSYFNYSCPNLQIRCSANFTFQQNYLAILYMYISILERIFEMPNQILISFIIFFGHFFFAILHMKEIILLCLMNTFFKTVNFEKKMKKKMTVFIDRLIDINDFQFTDLNFCKRLLFLICIFTSTRYDSVYFLRKLIVTHNYVESATTEI